MFQVRASYLKRLEDHIINLETERQQFPQEILVKLKEMDGYLNEILYKNRCLNEKVQFLSDERQILQNEIKILKF